MAARQRARVDRATWARRRAELALLQANYLSAAGRYTAVENNPVPVATITAGSVDALKVHHASPMQALLPAAGVGLLLSIVLAALLDYSRTGSAAPASGRSPVGPAAEPPLQGTVS